jgi:hypothetical protein
MENGQEPATKADLAEVKRELKADVAEVKLDVAMLRTEVHHVHDTLVERIADAETHLLKAFYTFAESNQTRLATTETDAESVKRRVGILEERVLQLERKVNFPNHPPQ